MKLKAKFNLTLLKFILISSPLHAFAVDYSYDGFSAEEIERWEKLRNKNSEHWQLFLYDENGTMTGGGSMKLASVGRGSKSNGELLPDDNDEVKGHSIKDFKKPFKFTDNDRNEYFEWSSASGVVSHHGSSSNTNIRYAYIDNSDVNSEILLVDNIRYHRENYAKYLAEYPNLESCETRFAPDCRLESFASADPMYYSLRFKIRNKSHVAGQIINLTELTLTDSLWEPRWDSDIYSLKTENSDIRFNTKNESLVVHENYNGGQGRFILSYDLKDKSTETPILTFEKDVTGTSDIILEGKALENFENLGGHYLVKVNTENTNAFRLVGQYKKGIRRLLLQKHHDGFWAMWQEPESIKLYPYQAQAANTLFNLRLNDKYSDIFDRTLPRKALWVRLLNRHSSQHVQGKTTPVEGNHKGIQLGGDIFSLQNQDYQLSFGLMGGQAEQRSTFRHSDTDNVTTGSMKGYSAGIYATWHQLQDKQTGAYIDSWMQYQRFRHRINTEDGTERFTSKGITASIEAGYNALLAEHLTGKGTQIRFYLQPQAQLTYLGVNGGLTDSGNSKVNLLGSRQLQTRVGAQAKAQFTFTNGVIFQPFVAVNSIYQQKPFGVEIDGERRVIDNKNTLESQLGVAVKIKSHLTLQATFNRQTGKHHHAKQGALNLQWTF